MSRLLATLVAAAALAMAIFLAATLESPSAAVLVKDAAWMMTMCAFAVTGALVVRRQPGTRMGWVLLASGTWWIFAAASGEFGLWLLARGWSEGGVAVTLLWLGKWTYVPALGAFGILLPLTFPTGRVPGGRWRALAAVAAGIVALGAAAEALDRAPLLGTTVENPLGVWELGDLVAVWALALFGCALLAVSSVWFRYRGAGVRERAQLKLLALAFTAAVGSFPVVVLVDRALGGSEWADAVIPFGLMTIPVAMGVAILRHGLYDIDRIVSRSVAWTVLTGVLALCYLAVALAGQALVPAQDSPAVVALATLTTAAAFRPARQRVQRAVDRRFNRSRYDAEQALAAFRGRLRDAVALPDLESEILHTLKRTLEPRSVSMVVLEHRRTGSVRTP